MLCCVNACVWHDDEQGKTMCYSMRMNFIVAVLNELLSFAHCHNFNGIILEESVVDTRRVAGWLSGELCYKKREKGKEMRLKQRIKSYYVVL